jgi:predicted RNase H-like nuclease (RuvC/YqgF family)
MPEEKRKINCWIPLSLYENIGSRGYENTTQAIIKALERLFEDPGEDTKGSNEDIEGYLQDIGGYLQDIEGYKQDIVALTAENAQLKEDISGYQKDIAGYKKDMGRIQKDLDQDITGYKEDIKALQAENVKLKYSLQEAREPGELLQLRARSEELEKHNDTLKGDLEKASQREEDLKSMHNNYMLQVQSLINQKAIEAPGSKKPWYKFW